MKPCSALRELGRLDSGREMERTELPAHRGRRLSAESALIYESRFSQVRRTTEVQVNK